MKHYITYLACAFALFSGCTSAVQTNDNLKFLKKGDYWIDCFDSLNINRVGITLSNDKLYCSTINISDGYNVFYCLDLTTGKVLWANEVSAWSTDSPIILPDLIYYVTFVGDSYAYNSFGKELWHKRFNGSLSGITRNPISNNLILGDVTGGFYEFDKITGRELTFTAPCDTCVLSQSLPVFNGKYLYFTTTGGDSSRKLIADFPKNALVCRNFLTNKTVWVKKLFGYKYAKFNNLYLLNSDHVYSLNGETGEINWQIKLDPEHVMHDSTETGFTDDRILCKPLGKNYCGIDYKTGKILPYIVKSTNISYQIAIDNKRRYRANLKVAALKKTPVAVSVKVTKW